MPSRSRRAGFSLAEALVVLGITSLLLILLFTVTARSERQGFRLADRALSASDRGVGIEALRAILRGVRLPRAGGAATAFRGEPDGMTAAVTPQRPLACADAPSPALRLQLDGQGGRSRLFCLAPGRPPALLLDLGPRQAGFSYALAGRPWTDRLSADPPASAPTGKLTNASPAPPRPPPRLWIRFASADGAIEVIEAVDAPTPSTAGRA